MRCTGHCCRDITINVTPGQLAERVHRADEHGDQARLISSVLVYDRTFEWQDGTLGYLYQCRELLPSGDCAIYDRRPQMCRDYASDGQRCNRDGCTQ